MENEVLFTDQKWNILQALSTGAYSPIELSDMTKTSRANISQQLKLLDAMSIVKKDKLPNRDKGKPRTLYSLSNDLAYIIVVANNFAGKRMLELDSHCKILLRIWFLENEELRYSVEKAFLKIEPYLDRIQAIFLTVDDAPTLTLVGENLTETANRLSPLSVKHFNSGKADSVVKVRARTELEFKKGIGSMKESYVIYDPLRLFQKHSIKGGFEV